MKEGLQLSEEEVTLRPKQFANALELIGIAERTLIDSGMSEVFLDQRKNGRKTQLVINRQVITGMKGGAFRMWQDLHATGQGELADNLLSQAKKTFAVPARRI